MDEDRPRDMGDDLRADESLMEMAESHQAMIVTPTIGHRAQLMSAGIPEWAADLMAVHYHEFLCHLFLPSRSVPA